MKPMGRKKLRNGIASAKHKPKLNGKNLVGWWETIVHLSKSRDRREAKQAIREECSYQLKMLRDGKLQRSRLMEKRNYEAHANNNH